MPSAKRAKKIDPCIAAKEWQKWSPLAHTLLTLWGQGEISAPTLQKIAHAARLSGCPSKDVQDFAALGTFGKHHQNCHRDLVKKMPQSLVPASLPVTCNVKDSKATAVDVRQIPLKLPCLWMHHLSIELEGTWLFQGFFGTKKLAEFWNKVDLKGPRWKDHKFDTKPNWKNRCIPVLLHGDGAEFQNNDSFGDMIYWILRLFSVRLGRTFFLMDISVCWLASWVTWNSSKNELRLNHQGSQHPCHLCKCNRDDIPWHDFSTKAAWRATQKNGAQKGLEHPLFKLPGVTAHSTCLDVLHVLDLGFTSHCLGNIIFDLVINILPGSRQQNLKEVWTCIQTNQREPEHGKQLSHFSLLYFCNPNKLFKSYPQMHHLKAAQCRMLVPVVHQLAHHYGQGSISCEKKKTLMFNLDMWYNFVYAEPMVPNSERAKEAVGYMNKALQCYQWLAADAVDKGQCMWSMVPKHHYSAEMAYQALYLNPRFVWTYGSEDYVGIGS